MVCKTDIFEPASGTDRVTDLKVKNNIQRNRLFRGINLKNIVTALILLFAVALPGFAEIFELDFNRLDEGKYILTYEEHYYDGVGESFLTVQKFENGYHAAWKGITDSSEVFTDLDFNTYKMVFSDSDTSLIIERAGNILKVSGRDKGKVVAKELNIKEDNWLQILSFSLMSFTLSDNQKVNFALFDPYNIKVRNMRIDKKGVETISVLGKEYRAEKLSMRMNGVLSAFWKSNLWNSTDNGLHLQYKGVNVIPTLYKARIMLKNVEFIPY